MDYKKDYLDGIRDLENLNKFEDDTVLLMHNLRMNRSKLNNNPQIGESYTQLTMHDPKFIKSNPFEGLESTL